MKERGIMEDNEIDCPYCGAGQEICHDDGYGYEEDGIHEQECSECEKVFHYSTSIHYYYQVEKAPCKNGEPHNWKKVHGYPSECFSDVERCSYCGEERKI